MALALERVLVSPKAFALEEATPLQRVICRIADGVPANDLIEAHPELSARGPDGTPSALERTAGPGGWDLLREQLDRGESPRELYVLSGIRTAKSLLAAAIAFRMAMTVELGYLRPWERAVISVLSLTREKALVVLGHLLGPIMAQPLLRRLLPREPTGSSVWLRRPHDGRVIQIRIAAGTRAGGSLVGDWSAGCIFDEFTRMTGEEEGSVINFDESRKAVLGRLLPGAQLVGVGSPWAPRGAAYEIVRKHWGAPTRKLVVVRPPAALMNPAYWTPETIEELRRSPKGESVYQTDFLGEFADPVSSFFTVGQIDAVTRKDGPLVIEPEEGAAHFAAIDPAMMRNAWTLVIARREYRPDGAVRVVIVYAKQWVPSREGKLDPEVIFAEIAQTCRRYRVWEVFTDRWKSEELTTIGEGFGLTVTVYGLAAGDAVALWDSFKLKVLTGRVSLPDDPEVRTDLLGVRRVITNRSMHMDYPFTTDGRHCDYAPALAVVAELASVGSSWTNAMTKLAAAGGRLL